MKKVVLFLALFILNPLLASEEGKNLVTSLSLEHYSGFYEDIDPETRASLSFVFPLSDKTQLGLAQGVTKYYVINTGSPEVALGDTRLSYGHKLNKAFSYKLGASLPVSVRSRENGKVTTLSLSFKVGGSFLDKKISVGYTPYANYTVNQYKSDRYGNLLNKIGIGNSLFIAFNGIDKVSLVAVAVAGINFKEQSQYLKEFDLADNGFYSFSFSASYAANENLGLRVGYSQGDAQLRGGVSEVYLYNYATSQYYFATDIRF